MDINVRTDPALVAENARLRARLDEVEDALRTAQSPASSSVVQSAESQPGLDASSYRFFGEIFGQINEAVIAIDATDRVTYLNEAAERQYGVCAGDALGHSISRLYVIRWVDPADEAVAHGALRQRGIWRGENIHVTTDGRELAVESSITALRGPNGQAAGSLAVLGDNTARKHAEDTLHQSEYFLRRVTDVTPSVISVFDLQENRSIFINRTVASLLNYTPEEISAMGPDVVRVLMHPEDQPGFQQHAFRVRSLGDKEIASFEHRMRDKAGEWHWFHSRDAVFARDRAGGVRQIISLAVDISERKRAEQLADQAQARLMRVMSSITDGLLTLDRNWRYTYFNDQGARMLGMRPGQLIGQCVWDMFSLAVGTEFHRCYHQAVETGKPVQFEEYYPDPINKWFECHCYPSDDGLSVYFHDITARKQAEIALRRSHDTYLSLIENHPFGVYLVDADFQLAQVSAGARKVFGGIDPLLGRDFAQILRTLWQEPFAGEAIARFRHTLATGESYRSADTTEHRGDVDIEESYDWTIERVSLPDGRFGVVCYFYDMTERKRYERHISLLMDEVNHRSKNLLTVVLAIARQTARGDDPSAFAAKLSQRIQGLAASQDLLVKNQWQAIEVSDLVRAQLAYFQDMIGNRVLLAGPPARLMPAAAQGIGMALHELTTNAAKYGALSNNDGRLSISWTVTAEPNPTFSMQWRESGGPEVMVPSRKGFGHKVIGSMAEAAVNGSVEIDYAKEGLSWKLTAPAANLLEGGSVPSSLSVG